MRNVQAIADAGEPHIVLEWKGGFDDQGQIKGFHNTGMLPGNATEDASRQVFGNCLDMRVLHITRDGQRPRRTSH